MSVLSLEKQLLELKESIQQTNKGVVLEGKLIHIVFISFGEPESRAYVCNGVSNTFEESWNKALVLAEKKIKNNKLNPKWFKADIVTQIKEFSMRDFKNYIAGIKINYFREGIAFDSKFKLSFLEQEVNANGFIYENKQNNLKNLVWKNINFHIKYNLGLKLLLDNDVVPKVYTFKTAGVFHDGSTYFKLGYDWLDNGRRYVEKLDISLVKFIIEKSSEFLASQVGENGQFRYGYFPCFDKEINHYNILRHASTTYSMIEAYEITKSNSLQKAITRALFFLVNEGIKYIEDNEGQKCGFVIEKTDNNSIKLGANAAAVLALSKYTEVFSDYKYMETLEKLSQGIAYFQNEDGSFVHVLNYPDLSIREKHRIIYYDGEAAFSLMRLYSIDKNKKWLDMVEKAFEYFIQNKYWRYNDHWLSCCSYELFLHKPLHKYLEFNLKNVEGILDFCLARETTFPTLLELLMASNKLIDKCRKDNIHREVIAGFDLKKLETATIHRAKHQLNGLMFPEVAMYFKVPKNILWGFYIRHHSFRVRIDDIEHNLSGYCNYYQRIRGV